ncbi:uncharacterized protein LOC142175238 [Nicotiana tabacum]|uniref:Uncharacterized protein LOC142175238 n=1 Tax=Nicotiana tabacum TaxID=4097 RepID=A0AC58TL18_TOBAC
MEYFKMREIPAFFKLQGTVLAGQKEIARSSTVATLTLKKLCGYRFEYMQQRIKRYSDSSLYGVKVLLVVVGTKPFCLRLKDLKAKNYLFQAIDRSILETILCKDTYKQIWDFMKNKYQGTAKAKRAQLQALRAEFETLRMQNSESVIEYFSRVMAISNKMRINGEKLEDVTIIEKILCITAKFNYIVCSIEESKDIDTLSIDELQSSLLVHELKINQQDKEELALKTTTFSKGADYEKGKWKEKHWYHKMEKIKSGDSQGKEKRHDKSQVECHRYGHYHSECRTNLNKNYGGRSNFAETKEDAETKVEEKVSLLMAYTSREKVSANLWYLDTGCINHICGHKVAFSELDETFQDTVKFGDNSAVFIMGKGKVQVTTKDNSILTISNVFYVPVLKTNLLSAGQLLEKRYELNIKGGKEMVLDLPQFEPPNGVCEECVVSKQHRESFPISKSWRAKKVLELVHSDICGRISPRSKGDASRKKLDDKGQKCIFLGISDNSKAYRLLNHITKKIVISRDVLFYEEATWNWNNVDCDHIAFIDVVKDPKWKQAMDEEIRAIERNNTWELTDLPENQKTIGVKWVYKTKLKDNGEVDKYKARLVAKGYKQEHGVDYE